MVMSWKKFYDSNTNGGGFLASNNWSLLSLKECRSIIMPHRLKPHHIAWVSGLPKGLGERRFYSPFFASIFPLQKRLILRLLIILTTVWSISEKTERGAFLLSSIVQFSWFSSTEGLLKILTYLSTLQWFWPSVKGALFMRLVTQHQRVSCLLAGSCYDSINGKTVYFIVWTPLS